MEGAEGFGGDSSQVARGELRAEEGGELEVVRGTGGGLRTPATVERGRAGVKRGAICRSIGCGW